MDKYFMTFVILFSSCMVASQITYRPMTKRNMDFGEDVCYYHDISDSSNIVYVKPCEEGKRCVDLEISDYDIHTCVAYDGTYDNKDTTCVTKDNVDTNGIDCTYYSCFEGICGKTPSGTCTENQVIDYKDSGKCVEEKDICYEYKADKSEDKHYSTVAGKNCVRFTLQSSDNGKTYYDKIIYSNAIASVADGEFIKDVYQDERSLEYCKSGYALYFYGNKNLNDPNVGSSTHDMYLMCVTVVGRDSNGIIKYKIGEGEEKYYDPDKLPYKQDPVDPSNCDPYLCPRYELYVNDEFLMIRKEMFDKYVQNLNDENESAKWQYFYRHPQEYLLYQNEPQVIEYLIKEKGINIEYKVKHTASKESSHILNIKYMAPLLSLLLLF